MPIRRPCGWPTGIRLPAPQGRKALGQLTECVDNTPSEFALRWKDHEATLGHSNRSKTYSRASLLGGGSSGTRTSNGRERYVWAPPPSFVALQRPHCSMELAGAHPLTLLPLPVAVRGLNLPVE